MNKVFMIGNLTRDPELSETSNGITFCKFNIAVNRNYSNEDGNRECDYFPVVVWRNLADNCGKFLSKGKKVAVGGILQNRTYDDRDGNKRTVTEIVANEVEFLSQTNAPSESENGSQRQIRASGKPKATLTQIDEEDDGLPF